MKEIIEIIMQDKELTESEKTALIQKIVMASHGLNRFIAPNYYLHTKVIECGNVDMQVWYREVDKNGRVTYGRTNWSSEQIVDLMKSELFKMKKKLSKKLN